MSHCSAARKPASVLKIVKHQKLHLMKQQGSCRSRPRTFSPIADPSSAVGAGLIVMDSTEAQNLETDLVVTLFGPLPTTSHRQEMKTGQQKQAFVINLRWMCVVLEHKAYSVSSVLNYVVTPAQNRGTKEEPSEKSHPFFPPFKVL